MLKRFFKDTKKYFTYIVEASRAQLKAEVDGSYLNWIWWILNPVCLMFIYYVVFCIFLNMQEEYGMCFLALGSAVWQFFNKTIKNSVLLMKSNKSIVSKVYVPKHIMILVRFGVNGFQFLISLGIVVVLMIIYQVPLHWYIFMAIPIFFVLALITFGISCILMHYGVYVSDLKNIVTLLIRFMFYLSGVFFSVSHRVPEPYATILENYNPIAYLICAIRQVVLYNTCPNLLFLLIWFLVGLILTVIGIRLIYKNENSYVKSI